MVVAAFMAGCSTDNATIIIGTAKGHSYKIRVSPDGRALLLASNIVAREFAISPNLANRLLKAAAASSKDRAKAGACPASLAMTAPVQVLYRGWFSPDLACPPQTTDERVTRDFMILKSSARQIIVSAPRP
jgi:hypothetical protein